MSESMAEELTGTKEHEPFANDVHGTSIGFPIERYAKPCSNVHRRRRLGTVVSSRSSRGVSQRFRLEMLVSNQGCRTCDDEAQG